MQTTFTIDIRTFGAERGTGLVTAHGCRSADDAVRFSTALAEEYGSRAPMREGQFICEIMLPATDKAVRSYRIAKKSGAVLIHQPDCRCTECGQLFRMHRLLGTA